MIKLDSFYKKIGQNIRAARKERGVSQEKLARAIGLRRPSLSNIEKGRQNLLLHTFCEILETLDMAPQELLPERQKLTETQMPDLTGYSQGVRDFVEAAIKPAGKGEHYGRPKTKNRKPD